MKILATLLLVLTLSVSAQNRKPSWSEDMPKRKDIPDKNIDIEENKSEIQLDRNSIYKNSIDTRNNPNQAIEEQRNIINKAEQEIAALELEKNTEDKTEKEKIALEKIALEKIASEKQQQIAVLELKKNTEDKTEKEKIALEKQNTSKITNTASHKIKAYTWRKIKHINPIYPHIAIEKHIEGWVNVNLSITPNGKIINADIQNTQNGIEIFNKSALKAVKKWKYEPPANYGIQNIQTKTVKLTFKL